MNQEIDTTFRGAVSLPDMPDDRNLAERCPPLELPRASLRESRLKFDHANGFDLAIERGFFLLEIPTDVDLRPSDKFAEHFYEEPVGDELDPYRGFAAKEVPGDYQGYFAREHDQWENFYLERGNWPMLPPGVVAASDAMARTGLDILRNVFERLDIPPSWWDEVTGGLTAGGGHQMLAANHFRADRPIRGSKFHRDSGWVTVLRSTQPGLLALIDGELRSILPEPGHFIVNFGSSMEILTEEMPRPVRANIHGVAATVRGPGERHRNSYVTFLDSRLDGTIYRGDGRAFRPVQSVADFAVQEVSRTYDDAGDL